MQVPLPFDCDHEIAEFIIAKATIVIRETVCTRCGEVLADEHYTPAAWAKRMKAKAGHAATR